MNLARIIEAGSTVFRNTLSGRLGVACCLGTCSLLLNEPTVSVRFSLTQTLQGEQYQFIEATQYHYLPTITSPSHTENFETQDRAKVKGSCWVRTDWLSDSLRAGSAELRGWLSAAVLRDLDRAWTLKTTEQDEITEREPNSGPSGLGPAPFQPAVTHADRLSKVTAAQ